MSLLVGLSSLRFSLPNCLRFPSHFLRPESMLEPIMVKWLVKLVRSHTGTWPFSNFDLFTVVGICN